MGVGIKYIIRKRGLGDVLWIEPVIASFAKNHQKVIVHTKYNQLFENYPFKNVVFKDRLSFFEKILSRLGSLPFIRKFIINLDNSYEQMPKQHFLNAYQKKAGLPLTEVYPVLYLSDNEKGLFSSLKETAPYVVIHVENKVLKNYRKVYGIDWEVVVKQLEKDEKKVYQVGAEDAGIQGAFYMPTTIREMIALLYHANLFIGVDSGPSHIAASLKVPSVIFFGAVNPDFRHFRHLFHGILLQQYCIYAGCFHTFQKPSQVICKIVGDDGMPPCCQFTAEEVLQSIKRIENYKD